MKGKQTGQGAGGRGQGGRKDLSLNRETVSDLNEGPRALTDTGRAGEPTDTGQVVDTPDDGELPP